MGASGCRVARPSVPVSAVYFGNLSQYWQSLTTDRTYEHYFSSKILFIRVLIRFASNPYGFFIEFSLSRKLYLFSSYSLLVLEIVIIFV